MSGPLRGADTSDGSGRPAPAPEPTVEIASSREAEVAGNRVRRALPQRARRSVGAWCFADHLGPVRARDVAGIGPHPHMGLQTVTWLVEGELVHRDSLGSEETVRPGQVNLMTAGEGISHAEEPTGSTEGRLHGIQLWVAQPESTRHGAGQFEHHPELPEVELGACVATVLVGALLGASSPARHDTDVVGIDLRLRPGRSALPLAPDFEHALVVLDGHVDVGSTTVLPGNLAFLGLGRDELALATSEPTRLLVLGGVPFESPLVMWWNFVARSTDEIEIAAAEWNAGGSRFGETGSPMSRIGAPVPPWHHRPVAG